MGGLNDPEFEEQFGESIIRGMCTKGKAWVISDDLCRILGVNKNRLQRLMVVPKRSKMRLPYPLDGNDEFIFVDREGVDILVNRTMNPPEGVSSFIYKELIPALEEKEKVLPKKILKRRKKKVRLVLEKRTPVAEVNESDIQLMDDRVQRLDQSGHSFIYMLIDGNPYFLGIETAKSLGYSNPRKAILDHVKPQDVTIRYLLTKDGRERKVKLINETGLYRLMFKSNMPEAEAFCQMVASEILPQIRKTGYYSKTSNVKNLPSPNLDPNITALMQTVATLAGMQAKTDAKIDPVKKDIEEIQAKTKQLEINQEKYLKPVVSMIEAAGNPLPAALCFMEQAIKEMHLPGVGVEPRTQLLHAGFRYLRLIMYRYARFGKSTNGEVDGSIVFPNFPQRVDCRPAGDVIHENTVVTRITKKRIYMKCVIWRDDTEFTINKSDFINDPIVHDRWVDAVDAFKSSVGG